jgi:hypothetical protein
MQHGELSVLLAYTRLGTAGVPVTRTGHPPHALGGEVKVLDPDGNTVLLGQRERSASQVPSDDDTSERFSLLREAAATHANEILMTVPAAFIASQGEHGIAEFLARRQ